MHATADPTTAAEQRPQRERDALARAAKAFTAKPSYAAYKALIQHYGHCPACAHNIAPCGPGRQLQQAWKAVRWS
ncbi:hypothetical protein [Streptomyces glomeratus]|uniref:Zinc-finger domain-containing protein n=1 Tax=Streptomyces glomeratus TaxID=284452 RepID=A0ABP6LW91_9ACTN|nr:hypothetical protein [Streptomyces glomeratus]MCF1510112.1 hypothetical protein [Streptomyces glomeratus]